MKNKKIIKELKKNLTRSHSVVGGIEEGFRIHPPEADKSRNDNKER